MIDLHKYGLINSIVNLKRLYHNLSVGKADIKSVVLHPTIHTLGDGLHCINVEKEVAFNQTKSGDYL